MTLAAGQLLGMDILDWIVLGGYFVMILGIGVWSHKQVKDVGDFFMGGRRFGKVFMMFFAFGSGTNGEQAIGVVAGTWRQGLVGIWWQFLWLWATPFYWIVAPVMRRMRALTTADFFEARYNSSTATLYSVYGIITSIVFMAGGLFGAGQMVNALTGGELDKVAVEADWKVPALHWDAEKFSFGSGVVAHVSTDAAQDLNDSKIPDSMAAAFTGTNQLSGSVSVEQVEAGREWLIEDVGRGLRYPIEKVTVTETVDGEEQEVQKLRIKGSGWRRIAGAEFAILAMTVMFVIYGMAGGLGAAIITDFVQGILTIAFSFLLLPYVFYEIGGFGQLNANAGLKEGMLNLVMSEGTAEKIGKEPITIFYVFMLSATALAGIVVQPHIMGVCGAGKTEFEGRFGFTFGNFLKRFCTMAWTFTGLACVVWYLGSGSPLKHEDQPQPTTAAFAELSEEEQAEINTDRKLYADLQTRASEEEYKELDEAEQKRIASIDKKFADELFGKAAYDILPAGLIGLLMASLLAAVMSSSDAQMVVSSGIFTENIYRRFIAKERSQNHYLWIGRFAGLIIVLLALILQSTFTDVIDALKFIIRTPAALGLSLWFGIVWRRWTPAAVWCSTLAAIGAWWFTANNGIILHDWGVPESMFYVKGVNGNWVLYSKWIDAIYISTGIVSGIAVSLMTPQTPKAKLDHFFRLIHTPITPGEVVKEPCTLPENPAPEAEKLFPNSSIELPKPTFIGLGGFIAAWALVGLIVWSTNYLSTIW